MAAVRRISAALKAESELDEFVGEPSLLFYDIETGELRISDGKTPGGWPLLPGLDSKPQGTLSLISTLKESDDSSTADTIVETCSDVRRLSFDLGSGFTIEEQDFNSVKIKHKADGFKQIHVDGQLAVKSSYTKAQKLDLVAGQGIRLNPNAGGNSSAIEIENLAPAATFGAIIDVSIDAAGDLIFTHGDMFDPESTYVSNAGYFIITTEEPENELWQR